MQLFEKAMAPGVLKTPWATSATLSAIDLNATREQTLTLNASITKVQEFLQKKLKPHRKQITAVRFSDGSVTQLSEATLKTIDVPAETPANADTPALAVPKAAVTVAQPVLGCPAPDFDDIEIRATRVLKTFLTPEQIYDFERRQQFVAVGADTGHRYLLTSRHSKHGLAQHRSHRSLYDMDDREALCVHDWEVPAAEELLGLFVHLSLPGLEGYIRSIPDREGILHSR